MTHVGVAPVANTNIAICVEAYSSLSPQVEFDMRFSKASVNSNAVFIPSRPKRPVENPSTLIQSKDLVQSVAL